MQDAEATTREDAAPTRRGLFGIEPTGLGRGAALAAAAVGGGVLAAGSARAANAFTDVDIFNFALNFEYLGAQYYLGALGTTIAGVGGSTTGGNVGTAGSVTYPSGAYPGKSSTPTAVPFDSQVLMDFVVQLAVDEYAHTTFLQDVLGAQAIAQPQIDFTASTPLAISAGVIQSGQTFNPYNDEVSFLLGAYVLEDVCVTALAGAAGLVQSKTLLAYAAGYLGVESQQAGAIRGFLAQFGMNAATDKISAARASLSGVGDNGTGDQGNNYNISNGDSQAQAFRRTPSQVLNIAYATKGTGITSGGLFPAGVNGSFAGFTTT